MITETQIEAAARSDAAFDGRTFDALGRADKNRYLERSRLALEAAAAVRKPIPEGFADFMARRMSGG